VIDCVFINGTVGSGKSTLAEAVSVLLQHDGIAHAVIDLDTIRRVWPSPADDPFNHEVELVNLGGLAANYRHAGAERFVLAGVVEEAGQIPRYEAALQSSGLLMCRLEVDQDVADARLRRRHQTDPAELAWHLARFGELRDILSTTALDDVVLDSSTATPVELARQVQAAARW
jgi:chloramphenicol 3-O-phosphotransferase